MPILPKAISAVIDRKSRSKTGAVEGGDDDDRIGIGLDIGKAPITSNFST